ncbi:MAG: peptidoglycan DD-metalloendopeptidase family protein [Eubacteriales bacterium]|nr:peptidoglycan DD-metalloendopeptidase family protein [Eubacteriales bacterium]MDD4422210.1 peptidoglycan DD-metalloendopeptidase family protein [Eubacteriales bacterium]
MMKSGLKQVFLTKPKSVINDNKSKFRIINPKYRNVIVTIMAFSIMLSGIFAFSVTGSDVYTAAENDNEEPSEPAQIADMPDAQVAFFTEEPQTVNAYGLYIDGSFIAAVVSEDDIYNSLNMLLEAKTASFSVSNIINTQFMNEIEIVNSEFTPDHIVESSLLMNLLGIVDENTYTFNLSSVSGEKVNTELSVMVQSDSQTTVDLAYDTEYVDTDLKTAGYEKVVNTGKVGIGVANYENVYIDGELVQSNYISTDIITEPVDEVIERGVLTKDKSVDTIGILEYPYTGRISSYYGWRDLGYHYGLDLVAFSGGCYGDDVHAAGDGVVCFAGTKVGFGTVIYIDHGSGLITVYGHLSAMGVKVGDIVKTSDVIGQIGATGRVTGPHLHFEVQKDGKRVDPLLYLKRK